MELKIAFFIIVAGISNALATPGYSQVAKVSLDMENKSIEQVMDEIELQSEFYFIFNQKQIDVNRVVDIQAENKLITDILPDLFKGTNVNYVVLDRKILLTTDSIENNLLAIASGTEPQQNRITGTVTDKDGNPLPGVNVVVTRTTLGTMTDIAGKYSIEVPQGSKSLTFSFIGMVSQEISIGTLTQINVTLAESAIGLEEVVVIGYGTQKKGTLTGAINAVEGGKLLSSPSTNISNTLAGQIPGLVVVTRSGEPGLDNSTLRIRGTNTLGNNNPLIVVDGIANRDFNHLNAADIESITVLKDASAAIYGAQSANGVILITTKRGEAKPSKINITLNQGWSKLTILPEMADAATYSQLINELQAFKGGVPVYTEAEIQKYKDGSDPWLYPNNNYSDLVLKDFAKQQNFVGSATGGSENVTYYISAGYKFENALYKNSNTNFSQVNFRSNIDGKISDNIKISFDLSGRQSTANQPNETKDRVLLFMFRGQPNWPVVWPNGLPGPAQEVGSNPVVVTTPESGYKKDIEYQLLSNFKLDINIPWVKGLSIAGNASFDKTMNEEAIWNKPWILYNWDRKTYDAEGVPVLVAGTYAAYSKGIDPDLTRTNTFGESITLNALINYKRTFFDKHNITALLGYERNTGKSNYLSAYRRYFISDVVDELFAGGNAEKNNTGSSFVNSRLNYFGRLNYNYLGKYLAEFVFRYDGSYIFPEKGRYGFFPGMSLGWNIAEEDFWKNNISFINYFKLRGSWGQTGNDRINPYQYLGSYGFVTDADMRDSFVFGETIENKCLAELRVPNPDVTWEVANQANVGFDGKIFKSNLNFSFDYFYNLRTNILAYRNASIPKLTGLSLPMENIGKVVNRGFEAEVGYSSPRVGDFSYTASVNAAYQKNYIKFWDEAPGAPEYQQSTGMPINAELSYEVIGVFRDQAAVDAYPHWATARPGDLIYKDVNEDGVINGDDEVRQQKTDLPTFNAGMSIDLVYKNFFLSALIQGAAGATRKITHRVGFAGNYRMTDIEGRWTADNPDATKPRAWDEADYWNSNNTYWLRNNDYIRFKNVQIGYNVRNFLGINVIKIYFSGLNLITLTKLTDYDPESTGEIHY